MVHCPCSRSRIDYHERTQALQRTHVDRASAQARLDPCVMIRSDKEDCRRALFKAFANKVVDNRHRASGSL
jgi:hypothetical protein